MKLTNRLGLPQSLLDAVQNDPYDKGNADFSVTELISPPRKRALAIKHSDEIVEDVSDRLWSLYGQIVHLILERANKNDVAETRLFATLGGYRISGQIDRLSMVAGKTLSDWKFTSAWGFMAGREPKFDWIAQLNCQRWLCHENGITDIESLEIIGLLRDWQLSKAKSTRGYPQSQVAKHEIEVWPLSKTMQYIDGQILAHLAAQKDLPECSPEDNWKGRRCDGYCEVSNFCTQYQQSKKEVKNGKAI